MKNIFFILVCLLVMEDVHSQNHASTIKAQAMYMVKALVKKDFPSFTKYIHPKVIEMAGGQEQLIQRMDTANKMAKQFGAEIKKILLGNPGPIIKYKNELQATLPQTSEMKTGFGNITLETTLIAISIDNGKNWHFIDTSVYNVKEVKKSLPNLSPDLVIPPMKPPKFTPVQQTQ